MKPLAGFALTVVGILLGLYLGIWVLFIGGIVSVIEAVKANPVDAYRLVWGIVKVILAAPMGWLVFFILTAISDAIVKSD